MKDQRKRVAKRLASGLLAGALALGGLALSAGEVSANTPSSPTTNRISGADRYETAAAVARAQLNTNADGTSTATNPTSLIIASGENFADALAGAQLATATRPLLLVKKDSIPAAVSDWIADYKTSFATGSRRVFILGGTSAISAATATAIQTAITTAGSLTPPVITRLSGDDRYATAKAISDFTDITGAGDSLLIANGENFPDALSAGAVAANNGWPMILTPASGLNASVKAKIDSFIALPGGTDQFVIIGSEAVVPRAIEEYIINTKGVSGSKIRRIQGADRYQTNFLTNAQYLLAPLGGLPGYLGSNVALVSGEAPWDALAFAGFGAKTGTHLVLTPTAGGNANVGLLAATLAAFNDAGLGTNQRLWVIGGNAAVSAAARTGYVAASATDMTATLTCPSALSAANRRVTLTLSGRANGTAPAFENATLTSISAISSVLLKNNVSLVGSVSAAADANIAGALSLGTTRKTYNVTLVAPPALNDVITFNGITEGTLVGTTGARAFPRSIGSASCTVGADTTRPTVTITSVAGTGGTNSASGGYFWINASEPITVGSGLAIQTNGDAVPQINFNGANPTVSATIVGLGTPSTRGSGLYYTNFLMSLADITSSGVSSVSAQVPYGTGATTLIVSASAFVDANGLSPSAEVRSTVTTDSASPTITPVVLSNTPSSVANYRVAPLSISAVSAGAYHGAKGSGWSLTVVNQRGLLKPTFVENATAKTLVVTADVGYHTPADVAQALVNAENSDWEVETVEAGFAGTSLLTATVSPASCLAAVCGTDVVVVALIANEPVHGLTAGYTVSVGGYGAPFVAPTTGVGDPSGLGYGQRPLNTLGTNVDTSRTLVVTTQFEGTGTISFQGATAGVSGITDLVGNYLVAPVTFTVT